MNCELEGMQKEEEVTNFKVLSHNSHKVSKGNYEMSVKLVSQSRFKYVTAQCKTNMLLLN